jgi:cobalamin biosynthesis Mg chelatase CobN
MYDTADEIIKGLNEKDKAVMPALIGRYGKQVFDKANALTKNENLSRRAMRNAFVAVLEYDGVFETEAQLTAHLERALVSAGAKLLAQRYKDVPEETLTRRSNAESEAALAAAKADTQKTQESPAPETEQQDKTDPAPETEPKEAATPAPDVAGQSEEPSESVTGVAEEEPDVGEQTDKLDDAEPEPDAEEAIAQKKPGRLFSAIGIFAALAVLIAVLINFKVIPI